MFQGSMVAIVTPMHPNGKVDYDALADLIDWHIEQKTDAIISVGTTGESATLSGQEHVDVIDFTVQQVHNRIPVIAGTGANSTSEAIELTKSAKDLHVDACLSVVPYYNKPTQNGLFQHFKAIADAVDLPMILYNVPGRTVTDMSVETTIELAKHPNIIGIKDASGDISRVKQILGECNHFSVLTGEDDNLYDFLYAGGHGIISVTANVIPNHIARVCMYGLQNQWQKTNELFTQQKPMNDALFIESNPIPVKYMLWKMAKIDKGIRLPLTWLDPEYEDKILEVMKKWQLI